MDLFPAAHREKEIEREREREREMENMRERSIVQRDRLREREREQVRRDEKNCWLLLSQMAAEKEGKHMSISLFSTATE